jgi:polysaccharide export outer membrane protein
MRSSTLSRFKSLRVSALALVTSGLLSVGIAGAADMQEFPPHTKIHITVVQWNATSGAYERWDALGGEYEIAEDRTVFLPVIGKLSVDGLDTRMLSTDIADALQAKIGLVQPPEATVAIVAYPPIYVVGDVKAPGEYKFSQGLTVLQSFAMGGGEFREETPAAAEAAAQASELRGLDDSILRSEITIARLQAEMTGSPEVVYPVQSGPNSDTAAAILRQERAIFTARANHIKRQSKSFDELREFFTKEMANLNTKTTGAEEDIKSLQEELRKMKPLVAKGLVVPAARNELERTIRSATGDRLDLATAIMRARQGIAEASRSIEALHDTQLTEVAAELQTEQSELYQLRLKRENAQQKLLDALSRGGSSTEPESLQFSVSRWQDGKVVEIAASESMILQPGDVVRVKRLSHQPDEANVVDSSTVTGQTIQ